jgi:hypothetical protein
MITEILPSVLLQLNREPKREDIEVAGITTNDFGHRRQTRSARTNFNCFSIAQFRWHHITPESLILIY